MTDEQQRKREKKENDIFPSIINDNFMVIIIFLCIYRKTFHHQQIGMCVCVCSENPQNNKKKEMGNF